MKISLSDTMETAVDVCAALAFRKQTVPIDGYPPREGEAPAIYFLFSSGPVVAVYETVEKRDEDFSHIGYMSGAR